MIPWSPSVISLVLYYCAKAKVCKRSGEGLQNFWGPLVLDPSLTPTTVCHHPLAPLIKSELPCNVEGTIVMQCRKAGNQRINFTIILTVGNNAWISFWAWALTKETGDHKRQRKVLALGRIGTHCRVNSLIFSCAAMRALICICTFIIDVLHWL